MYTVTNNCNYFLLIHVDITKPVIICPYIPTQYADRLKNTTTVFWNPPTYYDNSGEALTLEQNVDIHSGSSFDVGHHEIGYKVVDKTGNTANCSFLIIVDGKYITGGKRYKITHGGINQHLRYVNKR